ncbi:MAG TPA: glycerophosphodiester phosphodiesterase [Chthoniobacterales bacterium]
MNHYFTTRPARPLVVAHRGATDGGFAENTLAAFEAAIRLGADLIECDLRTTADGEHVIIHDDVLGGKRIGRCTRREVQTAGRALGYDIPTLGEVLELVSGRICLDLELKEAGYESDVVQRVRARLPVDRFVITSFQAGCFQEVKRAAPDVQCGLLLPAPRAGARAGWTGLPLDFARFRESGIDFLLPHWKLIRSGVLPKAAAAGLPAWTWTVNRPHALRACLRRADLQAVITDKVELALQVSAPGNGP